MAIPLKYNFRNLVARKTSTGMTAFVIGLVVAVFLCVLALVQGVTRTLSVTASHAKRARDARGLAGRDAERHHAGPGGPDRSRCPDPSATPRASPTSRRS